tara:strand:+ start:226 stop:576 length:351 start_codon:yes stop_codon:yes gene_type:complete
MKDNYSTPKWILKLFEDFYDPCPLNTNPKINGLEEVWKDKTYVNPPYSDPTKWIDKAIEENKKGKTIVMLLKVDPSTKWYRRIIEGDGEILFFNRRIKFNGRTPWFSSMMVIFKGR